MANAGYGNHTSDDTPKREPSRGPNPSTPDPAKDKHASTPKSAETDAGPSEHSRRPSPGENVDERHVSTPGAGSLPSDEPGDDADPGAG